MSTKVSLTDREKRAVTAALREQISRLHREYVICKYRSRSTTEPPARLRVLQASLISTLTAYGAIDNVEMVTWIEAFHGRDARDDLLALSGN